MNEIEAYAQKILKEHGCDEHTYWGEKAETLIDDLKTAYPHGMVFPYVDVANAIRELSKPEPIVRAPWRMIYDMGHTIDGIDYDSFEVAKESALDTLIEWEAQTISDWGKWRRPTEKQIEDWDYMIGEYSVHVEKYNPETDEYEDYWWPSYEDEQLIGWLEWADLKKQLDKI